MVSYSLSILTQIFVFFADKLLVLLWDGHKLVGTYIRIRNSIFSVASLLGIFSTNISWPKLLYLGMDSDDSKKSSRNAIKHLAYASMDPGRKDDLLVKMRNYRGPRSQSDCSSSTALICPNSAKFGVNFINRPCLLCIFI